MTKGENGAGGRRPRFVPHVGTAPRVRKAPPRQGQALVSWAGSGRSCRRLGVAVKPRAHTTFLSPSVRCPTPRYRHRRGRSARRLVGDRPFQLLQSAAHRSAEPQTDVLGGAVSARSRSPWGDSSPTGCCSARPKTFHVWLGQAVPLPPHTMFDEGRCVPNQLAGSPIGGKRRRSAPPVRAAEGTSGARGGKLDGAPPGIEESRRCVQPVVVRVRSPDVCYCAIA